MERDTNVWGEAHPAMRDNDKEHQAKLEALRAAVQAGFDNDIAEGDVIGRIRERIRKLAEQADRQR